MHISEVAPDLRDHVFRFCEDTERNTECHDDQADTEYRIYLTDDLIDRNKGCNKIVSKNDPQPHFFVCDHALSTAVAEQSDDQTCRTDCEYRADHDKKDNAEYTHDILHETAKIDSANLGDRSAVISLGHHAGEEVMDTACKDRTKGDPEEYDRAP